jgi:hypothetical protein
MSYDPHLLENMGDFKLHAAKRHLDNLKQLEDASRSGNGRVERFHLRLMVVVRLLLGTRLPSPVR